MIFVAAGPLTPAFPEGVARAGVRAAAASFEYWLRSLGLLISSGFQASGGSPGHPFQGAVAPTPGRGLQEMACGAGPAEVLLGSGLELDGLQRWRAPAGLRANARATASPHPPPRVLGSERGFPAVGGPSPVWEAPRERTPPESAPPHHSGFFLWAIQRSGREEKVAGTEGGNTAGLAPRVLVDLRVGGEGTDRRQGGSFAYENKVLVPSSGLAHFKALFHLNSSQKLGGAITLLPLGTFMLLKPRDPQNWVDMFQFATPRPELQVGCGGGAHNPKSWVGGAGFVAERKGEAWTMSQSPLPSTHIQADIPPLGRCCCRRIFLLS